MKKLLLANLLLIFALTANSQISIQESLTPKYGDANGLESFEKTAATITAKAKGMGYGGVNSYYTVSGGKSSTRFRTNELPNFYIKVEDGTELLELVVISKMKKPKAKKREFVISGVSALGSKNFDKYQIVPELENISENVYRIVLNQKLEIGEYAFVPILAAGGVTSTGKYVIYCFGID